MFEKVMDYVYSRSIKSESCLHPLLMSEPAVSKHTHTPHTHMHTHACPHTHRGRLKRLLPSVVDYGQGIPTMSRFDRHRQKK